MNEFGTFYESIPFAMSTLSMYSNIVSIASSYEEISSLGLSCSTFFKIAICFCRISITLTVMDFKAFSKNCFLCNTIYCLYFVAFIALNIYLIVHLLKIALIWGSFHFCRFHSKPEESLQAGRLTGLNHVLRALAWVPSAVWNRDKSHTRFSRLSRYSRHVLMKLFEEWIKVRVLYSISRVKYLSTVHQYKFAINEARNEIFKWIVTVLLRLEYSREIEKRQMSLTTSFITSRDGTVFVFILK